MGDDDSSGGIVDRLRDALQGVFLMHIPDHPAHGGNTGDTEWPPDRGDSTVKKERNGDDSTVTEERDGDDSAVTEDRDGGDLAVTEERDERDET